MSWGVQVSAQPIAGARPAPKSGARRGERLRVLHVIPALAPRYGGPSRAILEMCTALRSHSIQTVVATTDADGPGRLPVKAGCLVDYQGVACRFFPRQWSESFKYSRPLGRWLRRHVDEFDLVHIHAVFSHSSLAAGHACRRHGVPYLVRPLGSLDPWSLKQKRRLKRLLWHAGVATLLRRAARIHYTTSQERSLAEPALRLSGGVVVPLGVDSVPSSDQKAKAQLFRKSFPSLGRHPYVLVLSRLHPKKRLELVMGAFLDASTPPEYCHWQLVLAGVGDPAYMASLRDLAGSQGPPGRVHLVGWLEGQLRQSALNGAQALVLVSAQENFGLSAAEAMAGGVPVLVSSQVNLAPEIRQAGAGWVVSLSRQAVVAAFREVFDEPGRRRVRGEAGRRLVSEKFTWPTVAGQLADLYRQVVAGQPGGRLR